MDFSVVIPVYNNAATLVPLFERLKRVFEKMEDSFEAIFVEDVGQDASWEKLIFLKKEYPNLVHIFQNAENRGQHFATFYGFQYCRGKYVITLDADLQKPPEAIPALFEQIRLHGYELVYGSYSKKRDDKLLNVAVQVANFLIMKLLGIQQFGSSYKMIAGDLVKAILPFYHRRVFIDTLLTWKTTKVGFVPIEHGRQAKGQSNYSYWRYGKILLNFLVSSFMVRSGLVKRLGDTQIWDKR